MSREIVKSAMPSNTLRWARVSEQSQTDSRPGDIRLSNRIDWQDHGFESSHGKTTSSASQSDARPALRQNILCMGFSERESLLVISGPAIYKYHDSFRGGQLCPMILPKRNIMKN